MTPEAEVKVALKKRLIVLGAYMFWPVQTGYGRRSLDVLCCYRGRFLAIETKAPGEAMTLLQSVIGQQIVAAGGELFCIDNVADAERFDPDVTPAIPRQDPAAGYLQNPGSGKDPLQRQFKSRLQW